MSPFQPRPGRLATTRMCHLIWAYAFHASAESRPFGPFPERFVHRSGRRNQVNGRLSVMAVGAVMTVHKLSAGDGYTYLTRQVASADEPRRSGETLANYYVARGNPPGVWLGGGAAQLGSRAAS